MQQNTRQLVDTRINKLRKGFETTSSPCNFFPCVLLALVLLVTATNTNIREFLGKSQQQLRRSDDDFAVAKRESLGFFDDISSHHWELLKKKVGDMAPNFSDWGMKDRRNGKMEWFYQAHFEPEFLCAYERRIGRDGDGGKWICDPHRIAQKAASEGGGCLVYSVGSNNDFSFERELHEQISDTVRFTPLILATIPREPKRPEITLNTIRWVSAKTNHQGSNR